MTRLIDADAMQRQAFEDNFAGRISDGMLFAVNWLLERAPTIDAVPVIRCKDCKWWREDSDHTCKHFYTSPRVANDFCSYAEPKEEKR